MTQIDIEDLKRKLQTGVVAITFRKTDGSIREALATMHPDFLPEPVGEPKRQGHPVPKGNLLFYDITVEGYRSCVIDRIISVEKYGITPPEGQ